MSDFHRVFQVLTNGFLQKSWERANYNCFVVITWLMLYRDVSDEQSWHLLTLLEFPLEPKNCIPAPWLISFPIVQFLYNYLKKGKHGWSICNDIKYFSWWAIPYSDILKGWRAQNTIFSVQKCLKYDKSIWQKNIELNVLNFTYQHAEWWQLFFWYQQFSSPLINDKLKSSGPPWGTTGNSNSGLHLRDYWPWTQFLNHLDVVFPYSEVQVYWLIIFVSLSFFM